MTKTRHEVRDPIHGFIEFTNIEKKLIDAAPFQRLRYIHQLALTYQVYPGATHRRFEHSLGVMAVATRIYDRLFRGAIAADVKELFADELEPDSLNYWRLVVRIAALLHDVGHLPFSHAAEKELLPDGWNHERLTAEIIRGSEIAGILKGNHPPIDPEHVIDVAYNPMDRAKTEPKHVLSPWILLLNEIITGNTFGADRIDYLLRDSLHAGVAYGRFDPDRLISGLTLAYTPEDKVAIGLEIGAIHAAEALLLARYFMYTQVYFHDVRRAYDEHLKDFLIATIKGGKFPTDWRKLVEHTDNEVLAGLLKAVSGKDDKLRDLAERVVSRKHFRTVYNLLSIHKEARPTIHDDLLAYAKTAYGAENVRESRYVPKAETNNFPVIADDDSMVSSLKVSGVIEKLPVVEIGLIFVRPDLSAKAAQALKVQLGILLTEKSNGL